MRLDAFGGDVALDQWIVPLIIRDDRNVRRVAFVARAGMGDCAQFHVTSQTSTKRTSGRTACSGISVETTPMISRADFHAPPPPAGPFVYSVSTSLPIFTASLMFSVRPTTRTRTS